MLKMDKEAVKQAGLSDNESEVYLLLLQLNESLASEIAEKSKISRPHIYDTLAKLIEKGVASSFIKNGRKYFRPANPEVLLELLKAKEMSLQNALPDLKKLYTPSKEKPIVEVYEGKGGLKTILKEILREKKDFCGIGATAKWKEEIPIALEQYKVQRKKLGLKAKLLYTEDEQTLNIKENEYRPISKQFASPATTFIFGNKTCLIMWLDTIISILIDNCELADSFRSYFDMMWNEETTVWSGKEGLKAMFDDLLKEKCDEHLVMGTAGRAADIIPKYWKEFHRKRVEQGRMARRIYEDTQEARNAARKYDSDDLYEARFVPTTGKSPIMTIIYGNKVVFTAWSLEKPLLIMINNKEISNGFRMQFNQMWDQKQKTYQDIEGIKNVLMQIIDEQPKEINVYGSTGASPKLIPEFIAKWHKERIKNKVFLNIIYIDTKESRKRVEKYKEGDLVKCKFMPGNYESPVATFVYNNKVILMSITEDGFATVIENEKITKIYKKQFDTLWKLSKKN